MNRRLFCLIIALVSVAAAYITVAGGQQKRRSTTRKPSVAKPTPTPAPTPTPKRLSSIDEEAVNGCVAEFRKTYTVCDNAWLSEIYKCRSDRYILEFRDVTTMILDIGENRRLNPAVLAVFFAFDDKVSESNMANCFV
jgi:hypothetical protein